MISRLNLTKFKDSIHGITVLPHDLEFNDLCVRYKETIIHTPDLIAKFTDLKDALEAVNFGRKINCCIHTILNSKETIVVLSGNTYGPQETLK